MWAIPTIRGPSSVLRRLPSPPRLSLRAGERRHDAASGGSPAGGRAVIRVQGSEMMDHWTGDDSAFHAFWDGCERMELEQVHSFDAQVHIINGFVAGEDGRPER